MRLSFAVLGLLGAGLAGCASSESPAGDESDPARATAEAYDENGAPWKAPRAEASEGAPPDAAPVDANPAPADPVAQREPPTPPPHVNELFRTPGGSVASPSVNDPAPVQPVQPTPVQTSKPAPPPPKPPPRPSPRPWGGNDPCPPCGMG